jgi:hypothetical protein
MGEFCILKHGMGIKNTKWCESNTTPGLGSPRTVNSLARFYTPYQHSFYSWLCCAFFMLRRCCASAAAPVSGELTRIVSPFATFGVQALPAAPIQAHAIQQDELKLLRDDYANGVPLNSSAQHVNC